MKLAWVLIFALVAVKSLAAPFVVHVATNGNNNSSGVPGANPGDGPLATIPAALAKVRSAPRPDGATIFIHDGVHRLSRPLVLTPDDSGSSPEHPFVISAHGAAKPTLSGGVLLTGWRQEKPGRWTAPAPTGPGTNRLFRSLFINGRRATRARTPNAPQLLRMDGPRINDSSFQFKFHPGDIKPAWIAPGDVEVVAYEKWTDIRQYIRAINPETRTVTLSGWSSAHTRESDARYYVENATDALDLPGEWLLDAKAGLVTALFAPGEDPNTMEIVMPRLQELVQFKGDPARNRTVRHVVLRGLTFADTDWTMASHGYRDTQAAIAIRGDVYGDGMMDCRIERCTFTRLAGYGIDLRQGCQRNHIVHNELFDLGAGGVRVGETTGRSNAVDATHSNVITDNHLHHLGRLHPPAVGILILQSATNRVAHNHIHDLYYTAISVGWTWGYINSPCHHNVIEFNHLHHIGLGLLSDMGAVYTLGPQPGTVIRNNRIHDVTSFNYGGWGLYTDEGSTGIILENNVVYRCKSAGFHQHYGKDNVVRNNIFAFNGEHQLMRTRDEPHNSFTFTNNVVAFDSGTLLGNNWRNDRFRINRNVYWDTRADGGTALQFSGSTVGQWRARGHDTDSIVADPRFVDPKRDDFRLLLQSPAFRLGFRPIDLSGAGPR